MSLIENGKHNIELQRKLVKEKNEKLRKNTMYISNEEYKLIPTKILEVVYKDKEIHEYITELANVKAINTILSNRIKETELKHECSLEDLKTKESHIPLILEKNHAGYITKASINHSIVFLNNKSEIPSRINKGCFKYVDSKFIEDKNKTLMYKEVI